MVENAFLTLLLSLSWLQRSRFKSVESLQSIDNRAIVVCSDVAARGLDIPSVSTVIHYDVARKVDDFVHRAGRTAVSDILCVLLSCARLI